MTDLEIDNVHNGSYVDGVIISDPFKLSAVHFDLEDSNGSKITCSVYDYDGVSPESFVTSISRPSNTFGFRKGQRVRILDPWCKFAMDGKLRFASKI